ncbi:GNAT family N-acetyltransferase [Cohnella soli]|uniref:GNAT family N-acetyltransferase n=1 Tax=Cohnella soli TaxID=425005 RepID=A0ABW0HSS6_9BACL
MRTEDRQLPQLVMRRASLSDLPELLMPAGFRLRQYEPGDAPAWEALVEKAFGWKRDFQERIASRAYFRPERVLFICNGDVPAATACAWEEPAWEESCGYLHMVGVNPDYSGRGLGYAVSLAALRRMREDGKRQAVLETDDFRLAAIKTYFKLGFQPDAKEEAVRERWRRVGLQLNMRFMEEG